MYSASFRAVPRIMSGNKQNGSNSSVIHEINYATVEGDRHMYLRLQHWLPIVAMDVNSSTSPVSREREVHDLSSRSSRPSCGTLMCWRDMGTTFVVNHQDPLYESNFEYPKSSPSLVKRSGSRFEHLLAEHFFAQSQTCAPKSSTIDQLELP